MKNVLITGAAGELGMSLVEIISHDKNFRIFASTRKSSLGALSKFKNYPNVVPIELDLMQPESFEKALDKIRNYGGIDILINNAAISNRAVVEHVSDDEEKKVMQTNYFAPRELIRLSLKDMWKKKGCKIINVSSVGGIMAMPTMSSYSASKWALEGMSESLWYELKPFKIKVTLVEIGFVHSSGFTKTTEFGAKDDPHYLDYSESMREFITKMMNSTWETSDSIALKIYKKIIQNPNPPLRVFGTFDAMIFTWIRKLLPQDIYHFFLYCCLPYSVKSIVKQLKKIMGD